MFRWTLLNSLYIRQCLSGLPYFYLVIFKLWCYKNYLIVVPMINWWTRAVQDGPRSNSFMLPVLAELRFQDYKPFHASLFVTDSTVLSSIKRKKNYGGMVHKRTKWNSTSKHHIVSMPKNLIGSYLSMKSRAKSRHNYADWTITQVF